MSIPNELRAAIVDGFRSVEADCMALVQGFEGPGRYINIPFVVDGVVDVAVFDRELGGFTHIEADIATSGAEPLCINSSACLCDTSRAVRIPL